MATATEKGHFPQKRKGPGIILKATALATQITESPTLPKPQPLFL